MPRIVDLAERYNAAELILLKDENGDYVYGQREIEQETGLSRQYIRKLARELGRQFDRNGIEVQGKLCVCANCNLFFRRSPSKADRAKRQFCDTYCKESFMIGESHPNWKGGKTVSTFSKWIVNQKAYKEWRQNALDLANYCCQITGIHCEEEELDVHHIKCKADFNDLALDPKNALVVSKEVHRRIHALIHEGKDYEEAVEIVKKEYHK